MPSDPQNLGSPTLKVRDRMTRGVRLAAPDAHLRDAARVMAELGVGALPVSDGNRLIGIITDRDMVVRGLAAGRGPEAMVRDVMTPQVKYCFDHQDLELVARLMSDQQISRLAVVNNEKQLVGILSLGEVADASGAKPAGDAWAGTSRPAGGFG